MDDPPAIDEQVIPPEEPMTPREELFLAIELKDVENARAALERGADREISVGIPSPLATAALHNDLRMVVVLLDFGGDPNASRDSPLEEAIRNENTRMVELFMRSGARVPAGAAGQELFRLAQRGSAARELSRILLDYDAGADLCLAAATAQARVELMEYCLSRGAVAVNLPESMNALGVALASGESEIVDLILAGEVNDRLLAGAFADAVAAGREDLVQRALSAGAVTSFEHIEAAVESGEPEICLDLLAQSPDAAAMLAGGDVEALSQRAADLGFTEVAEALRRNSGVTGWAVAIWLPALLGALLVVGLSIVLLRNIGRRQRPGSARGGRGISSAGGGPGISSAGGGPGISSAKGGPGPGSRKGGGGRGLASTGGGRGPGSARGGPGPGSARGGRGPGSARGGQTQGSPGREQAMAPWGRPAAPAPAHGSPGLRPPPAEDIPGPPPAEDIPRPPLAEDIPGPPLAELGRQNQPPAIPDVNPAATLPIGALRMMPPVAPVGPVVPRPPPSADRRPRAVGALPSSGAVVTPSTAAPVDSAGTRETGLWRVAPEPEVEDGPADSPLHLVSSSVPPQAAVELRMPEVDLSRDAASVFEAVRQASSGETVRPDAPDRRHVILVTPSRVTMLHSCPAPGSLAPEQLAAAERLVRASPGQEAGPARNVAVIAYTDLDAMSGAIKQAIPFFDLLRKLAYSGHAVWIFEGHVSAMAAGCHDADVLIVDDGMMPYLPGNWRGVATRAMRGSDIHLFERKTGALRRLS